MFKENTSEKLETATLPSIYDQPAKTITKVLLSCSEETDNIKEKGKELLELKGGNTSDSKQNVTLDTQTKVEESKVNETKVNETKVGETKVEESKVNETKVEETKVEETKVNETKVNETKVNQSKVNQSKVNETKVNETKVNETKVEESKDNSESIALKFMRVL